MKRSSGIYKIIAVPIFLLAIRSFAELPFTPSETGVKLTFNFYQGDVLMPIMNTVSNAILSVDKELMAKNYRDVKQFNRTIWLESIDKSQSTVWQIIPTVKITPEGTNLVVGAIKAISYQDPDMTKADPSRSFQIDFFHETGALRSFVWNDHHEVLQVEPLGRSHGGYTSYGRTFNATNSLVMSWDEKGGLISSNVYDWTKRGRVISGWTVSNTPIYEVPQSHKTRSKLGR